jgi:hypothetical protein
MALSDAENLAKKINSDMSSLSYKLRVGPSLDFIRNNFSTRLFLQAPMRYAHAKSQEFKAWRA